MRKITTEEYEAFISEEPFAVVHFDAEWDHGYRPIACKRMIEAQVAFTQRVCFGEIDVDAAVDLARAIPILNVPTIAYYRHGELVAALIGADQNVKSRVDRMMRGEPIGPNDGTNLE
jgi:thioredoxin-like negative regulator of GroEL